MQQKKGLKKDLETVVKVCGSYDYARDHLGAIMLFLAEKYGEDPMKLDDAVRPIVEAK